ncbi:MAG: HEAT repeat domain-containing protein [Acutalibacteraceae bacterium]
MIFSSVDKKLDFLDNVCDLSKISDETWNSIVALSMDNSSEVRMTVAEKLFYFSDERIDSLLLDLLDDNDYLVRCEACISLQNRNSIRVFDKLLLKVNDRNYLVRGYAVISAATIAVDYGLNVNSELEACLSDLLTDPNEWVTIAALYSLVLLGNFEYEERLLNFLNSENYQNRSFVLTLLDELIDKKKIKNICEISKALTICLQKEKNEQIYDKISKLLNKCNK